MSKQETVQRYDHTGQPAPQGAFVHRMNYAALEARLQAAEARLKALVEAVFYELQNNLTIEAQTRVRLTRALKAAQGGEG